MIFRLGLDFYSSLWALSVAINIIYSFTVLGRQSLSHIGLNHGNPTVSMIKLLATEGVVCIRYAF
jgi:hypothetical protein